MLKLRNLMNIKLYTYTIYTRAPRNILQRPASPSLRP